MVDGDSDGTRQPVETTHMTRLCSAIDNKDAEDGTKTAPTAQIDDMSKIDDRERTRTGSTTRVDEVGHLSEVSLDTY